MNHEPSIIIQTLKKKEQDKQMLIETHSHKKGTKLENTDM